MDNPECERKPVHRYHDHSQEEHEFLHACCHCMLDAVAAGDTEDIEDLREAVDKYMK